jgi:hypothetical protein
VYFDVCVGRKETNKKLFKVMRDAFSNPFPFLPPLGHKENGGSAKNIVKKSHPPLPPMLMMMMVEIIALGGDAWLQCRTTVRDMYRQFSKVQQY